MNDFDRRALLGAAGLVGVAALAGKAKAGPLTPPAGAVAPSGRTLDEIYNRVPVAGAADGRSPIAGGTTGVTISTPGSYVLTGNLTANGTALTIAASDVTIDLNGHTVTNTQAAAPSRVVTLSGSRARIVLRNGRVVGGDNGINVALLSGQALTGICLEDLAIFNARSAGVAFNFAGVSRVLVRRCSVVGVGSTTVAADAVSTLSGVSIAGGNNRVEDCSVSGFEYNGTGSPSHRGITMSSNVGGAGNHIVRCCVSNDTALTGEAIRFFGSGVYRDNTVMNFSTSYAGGTNGGGNV